MQSKIKFGVSLYCYQDEFARHTMTLEECIEAVSDMGADGIEILPDMMIPDWANVSDEFLDKWFGWMAKYGTTPVGVDAFCDEQGLYRKQNRKMPLDEAIALQKSYIDICHKLGGFFIRFQHSADEITEALIPYAEERGITLGLEIHAPGNIKDERIQHFIELREKHNTKALGLIPDFGIWETRPTPIIMEQCIRDGCSEKYVRMAEEKKAEGWSRDKTMEFIKNQPGATPGDYDGVWRIFNVRYDDPNNLRSIMPYIISVHGKFWEMKDDMTEASVDYENPMRILIEEGYDKYICSEYEGGRHMQDVGEVRGVEQTRRHHAMMRNLCEKYSK